MKYLWERPDWPVLRWKSDAILSALGSARLAQGRLLAKIEGLGFRETLEAQGDILVEEALQTSAIEGERLDALSVRSSVARQLGLPTAGLPAPDHQVDGLVEILLDATRNHKAVLTGERLKGWHAALFPTGYSGLHKVRAGRWRSHEPMRVISGPLGRERIHFEAPPGESVPGEMKGFLAWWKKSSNSTDGLIRAGLSHLYFVTIHPFEDGNGRLARALTNMALAQDDQLPVRIYSLSRQIMAERQAYYDILERTQNGTTDVTHWLLWFLSCYERAVRNSEEIIGKVLLKANFWTRDELSTLNDRQRKVVARLLEKEPEGFEGGLTTRKYISMTRASRATAFREIADMVAKGILAASPAQGRSTSYRLVTHA